MNRKFLVSVGLFMVTLFAALIYIGFRDDDPPLEPPKPPVKKIQVYVSGQVKNISVVELEDSGNLRVVDAVNLAGGLTDLADTEAVNLAAPISDGQHVHIPTKEIFLRPTQEVSAAVDSGDKVNINTADAAQLQELVGVEARSVVPGHIQRGGTPSAYDRVLSTEFGVHAAELIRDDIYGVTVALKGNTITHNALKDIAGIAKPVPMDDPMISTARNIGISFGD